MLKRTFTSTLAAIIALLTGCVFFATQANATPYASGLTYNAVAGTVTFYLNEGGGNVTVSYEDGTTNASYNGFTTGLALNKGKYSFVLGSHTGYAVSVTKIGNGIPFQTSFDNAANANNATNWTYWNSPRGVSVNQNPKIGSLFGRVYVDNTAASSSGFPTRGIYALNADLSPAITNTAPALGIFTNSGSSGPYRLRVAPDNTLIVGDFSTAAAALWQFAPDLNSSNLFLGPVGQNQGVATYAHGDMFGTAHVSGSLATSNLVLWTADSGMPIPTMTQDPTLVLGPGATAGMYNNVYRYDIGAGPLPWTNAPNYAFNLGLDVIAELAVEVDVAPDGKIFAAFGRANLSNPDLTVLDPSGLHILWTSWVDSGGNGDPWRGDIINNQVDYPYAGVRVSSDDKYIAHMGIDNAFLIATLTNGVPDASTLYGITNLSATGNARGMDWDIVDNIYGASSGQGELRAYSLGITATCITSNDITGINGTFVFMSPSLAATAVATTPTASQGYGTPTAGVITISLNTNVLTTATTVNFLKSGTAVYTNNYLLNLGVNTDGVIITPTNVIFPAGTYPHAGNWSVAIQITPTIYPLSGPTTTATIQVNGGANNLAGIPSKATVSIINTGPQLLTLSVLPSGASMSRAVTNDYILFKITRFGDTTVPAYTVTNINYQGTATYPGDYTAQAQRFTGSLLSDGSPGIIIFPGEVFITNAIGNPVMRANVNSVATNVTIILSLTNPVTGTSVTSQEGYTYVAATNAITLTELDNTVGSKVVLWSNSLNSAADSVNWTLTYASENLGTNTQPPVVVPNYVNGTNSVYTGGTNDFDVEFGYPLPSYIPPSPAMLANGWTNVLKMTVNKNQGTPAGVNLYPQGQKFYGNYALRFSMYLSIWDGAIGNFYAGAIPREYAIFCINESGTNCNWRPSRTAPTGTSGTTNADGIWFALDAGDNAATPADFDAFTSPGLPNAGVTADLVSNPGSAMRGIFKNPPFVNTQNPSGGEPVDQWADVSVEVTAQTNCTIYVNGAPVLTSFTTGNANATYVTNPIYASGNVMLGYLDPDASIGDPGSQFVYYSNIRAVELSPYITAQPVSLIVTQGVSVTFTNIGAYGTAPITNVWNQASTNAPFVLTSPLSTDTAAATNITSILSLANVQSGTNFVSVISDAAGSVTSLVARLEVIIGPTNQSVLAGSLVKLVAIPTGTAPPTAYQWRTNGVPLVNNTHFAGVTTATLIITNIQFVEGITYTVNITNAAGSVAPSATITVINPLPPAFSTIAVVGTNAVLQFTTPNGYDTTNSFTLQSSVKVSGPYVNVTGTITNTVGGFQFTIPVTTNNTMFYRLIHN